MRAQWLVPSLFGLLLGLLGCRPESSFSVVSDAAVSRPTDLADSFDLASLDASYDLRSSPNGLRALTLNTHLFFDTVCDSGRCGSGDFEQVETPQDFAARADTLARAIRSLSSDVVALQEIENQSALRALSSRLGDLYPVAVLGETGAAGSIDVAILGKGTLLEVRTHRARVLYRPDGSSTYFSRELLEVHLSHKGRRIVMFAAHFRSKVSDDPGRRLAEAQAAAEIMKKTAAEFPDALVLLGGDLNDTPGSAPISAMESDPALVRVAKDRPLSSVATYSWNGNPEAIDHLFWARSARSSYVAGSASAQRDAGRFGFAGSDHAALLADFALH
ncbi:MAG: endonuclease/exonuclease/phosphatase family protein [Myxococcales bacterium]|nr:endonuclease/exonuclease/phosphatase family protein [Myxococcales bacterium]